MSTELNVTSEVDQNQTVNDHIIEKGKHLKLNYFVSSQEDDEKLKKDFTSDELDTVNMKNDDSISTDTTGTTIRQFLRRSCRIIHPPERHDDNSLFDFGLTPMKRRSGSSTSQSISSNETPINFDDAIIHICPACGEEFKEQSKWKRHLNIIHNFNTRRGLNFIQLDKIYHQCLECDKRIAMHSMENLLKHKFTHLPHRCSKCSVCKREYKYRQDLMVHIRMRHYDDLLETARAQLQKKPTSSSYDYPDANIFSFRKSINKNFSDNNEISENRNDRSGFTIGDVKENAFDIFENTTDIVEVKKEYFEPNEKHCDSPVSSYDKNTASVILTSFLDDFVSNDSTNPVNVSETECDPLEEYILFMCPQCGTECDTEAQWRQHIEFVHDFGSYCGLKFKEINKRQQAQCLECKKVITPNVIKILQEHKFIHLAFKEWLLCKLCFKSFNVYKNIINHLNINHHLRPEIVNNNNNHSKSDFNSQRKNNNFNRFTSENNPAVTKQSSPEDIFKRKLDERNVFEQYIAYLCPQCAKKCNSKKSWQQHLNEVHHLSDFKKLRFVMINENQLQCLDCYKIIANTHGLQNAQQHRISHMKYKSFAQCRLCLRSYSDRKGLVKHLRNSHRVSASGTKTHLLPLTKQQSSMNNTDNLLEPLSTNTIKNNLSAKNKEIICKANCIYEICYLDENNDENDNISNKSLTLNDEVSYNNLGDIIHQDSRNRCADCDLTFTTTNSLLTHVEMVHNFKSMEKSMEKNDKSISLDHSTNINNTFDENSNDPAGLLKPIGDADIHVEESTRIECNFIYLCPQCGKEFRTQNFWRRHINIVHNFDKRDYLDFSVIDKLRYKCNVCGEIVQGSKLKGLQDHKFRHCKYKLYLKCLLCGIRYNHKPNMLSHLRQRHNIIETYDFNNQESRITLTEEKPTVPFDQSIIYEKDNENYNDICNNVYLDYETNTPPSDLKTIEDVITFHNAVDHESITYHCPSCFKNFDTHVYWRKHIVEVHNLNNCEGLNFRQLDEHHYICQQCYKRVTVTHTKGAIGQLQSHKFRHLPYRSFHCNVCQGEFVRKQMFFKHLNKDTNLCMGLQPNDLDMDLSSESNHNYNNNEHMDNHNIDPMDEFDDELDLSGALVQCNDNNISGDNKGIDNIVNKNITYTNNTNDNDRLINIRSSTSSDNKSALSCYTINCPECGNKFESLHNWREHINIKHNFNNRSKLNFKTIRPSLHQCLECKEYITGSKLRKLQVHKFRHMPYGPYVNCCFCKQSYYHISNLRDHIKVKHADVIHQLNNTNKTNIDDNDNDDVTIIDNKKLFNNSIGENKRKTLLTNQKNIFKKMDNCNMIDDIVDNEKRSNQIDLMKVDMDQPIVEYQDVQSDIIESDEQNFLDLI